MTREEDDWFEISIVYRNQEERIRVRPNFVVMRVLEEAVKVFGLSPPLQNWQLFNCDDPLTDLNESLESCGVEPGSTLTLAHEHVVG